MCGIIGYVGHRDCQQILLNGLRRLEYRGYDSAGLAWHSGGHVECVRAVGNLDSLVATLAGRPTRRDSSGSAVAVEEGSSCGIGHTRWATHGGVTVRNAHPHADTDGHVWVVLNGIIENHVQLRERLAAQGIRCSSETDAEVVAHLISLCYDGDLGDAVRRAVAELEGHYALVTICDSEPDTLAGARHECPLVLGTGEGEHFIASAITAFRAYTDRAVALGDGEIAVLTRDRVTVSGADGAPRRPQAIDVHWAEDRCDHEGFETFMLKEIHEQGRAVAETLSSWDDGALVSDHRTPGRIVIVGCGTSYHAGLAGKLAIERWARIPVEVDVASEFRYRDPIVGPDTLVLGITQSGETADTLAAMRLGRARGARVLAVTNAPGSQATREADAVLFTRAGTEVGVAATKTFVAQVALLYLFAATLARSTGRLTAARVAELHYALDLLPERIDAIVRETDADARRLAWQLAGSPFFLYLGRLSGVPVAMEGALKLKEISYVPTDAYAAGEMKHGPIALLSVETPVVCVATEEAVLPKLLSNMSEVQARGARVLAVATEGLKEVGEHAEHVFYVPRTDPLLQVVLAIVPLQLFAYHLARARGLNVDQPRNLAKTVTVE
jgi:glutamine---fructose-6-phosphate transaminase (isomerizing)